MRVPWKCRSTASCGEVSTSRYMICSTGAETVCGGREHVGRPRSGSPLPPELGRAGPLRAGRGRACSRRRIPRHRVGRRTRSGDDRRSLRRAWPARARSLPRPRGRRRRRAERSGGPRQAREREEGGLVRRRARRALPASVGAGLPRRPRRGRAEDAPRRARAGRGDHICARRRAAGREPPRLARPLDDADARADRRPQPRATSGSCGTRATGSSRATSIPRSRSPTSGRTCTTCT